MRNRPPVNGSSIGIRGRVYFHAIDLEVLEVGAERTIAGDHEPAQMKKSLAAFAIANGIVLKNGRAAGEFVVLRFGQLPLAFGAICL